MFTTHGYDPENSVQKIILKNICYTYIIRILNENATGRRQHYTLYYIYVYTVCERARACVCVYMQYAFFPKIIYYILSPCDLGRYPFDCDRTTEDWKGNGQKDVGELYYYLLHVLLRCSVHSAWCSTTRRILFSFFFSSSYNKILQKRTRTQTRMHAYTSPLVGPTKNHQRRQKGIRFCVCPCGKSTAMDAHNDSINT